MTSVYARSRQMREIWDLRHAGKLPMPKSPARKTIGWKMDGSCIRCTSHASNTGGYPQITRRGKASTVIREILRRRLRNPSFDIVSRHTCDNRWCINPNHIISGTRADNVNDCVTRNRHAKGERIHKSKLDTQDVRDIRNSSDSRIHLSAIFGVDVSTIDRIRNRKTWKHVE